MGAASLSAGWLLHKLQVLTASVVDMQVRSCWDDIVEALMGAEDFIYICGWSMHPETRLKRDRHGNGVTVGELLKQKAAEKVNVCLLVRTLVLCCCAVLGEP